MIHWSLNKQYNKSSNISIEGTCQFFRKVHKVNGTFYHLFKKSINNYRTCITTNKSLSDPRAP